MIGFRRFAAIEATQSEDEFGSHYPSSTQSELERIEGLLELGGESLDSIGAPPTTTATPSEGSRVLLGVLVPKLSEKEKRQYQPASSLSATRTTRARPSGAVMTKDTVNFVHTQQKGSRGTRSKSGSKSSKPSKPTIQEPSEALIHSGRKKRIPTAPVDLPLGRRTRASASKKQ